MAETDLQIIKDKLDIIDVISGYIPVKKSGTNYKAVCPFHNEKSASLMVSQAKQIWHCFGCGLGGDIFGFVMRYENLEFIDALKELADRAGVELSRQPSGSTDAQKQLVAQLSRINNFAASFYEKQLSAPNGKPALEYLHSRGLNPGTIAKWRIGFAPNSYDQLLKALSTKKVSEGLGLQAGILYKSEKGKVFDRFRGRVMFPIYDINSSVVGFTARVLPGSDSNTAKYINTPETALYNKSKIMFGLNFAKDQIRKKNQVVVVEGQMDCISSHQSGFDTTVATSGTALTMQQLKLLKRFTNQIIFAFDGDEAGQNALYRAVLLAVPLDFDIRVISSKNYGAAKDPDEVIKKSPATWQKLIDGALRVLDYYLQLAQDNFALGSIEQKRYITDYILPIIRLIKDPLQADHYTQKINQDFSISITALNTALKQESDQSYKTLSRAEDSLVVSDKSSTEHVWEKEIIGGLLVIPDFKNLVMSEGLSTDYFSDDAKPLFLSITANLGGQNIQNSVFAGEATFVVESLLENLNNNQLALMRELKKSFYLFKRAGLNKELTAITIALKQAELNKNLEAIKELGVAFNTKSTERFQLENKLNAA